MWLQKQDLEWASVPSHTVSIYQHLLKGWRLWNPPKNVQRHRIRTRENGSSLNFNFILLPSPVVDVNWGLPAYYLLHSLSSENDAMSDCDFQIIEHLHFFPCVCVRARTHILSFNLFCLLTFKLWVPQQSSYSIIFSCLFTNSRLCCTYFSYHWRKIRNVSCQLMQITKGQHDPWGLNSIVSVWKFGWTYLIGLFKN